MGAAGFKSPILEDIRAEIWLKLWGNMTFNPISALTHGHLEGICQHPLTKDLARNMMAEAQTIGWISSAALVVLKKSVSTKHPCCKI
jgi:2-dehydropantoate 2-reductase